MTNRDASAVLERLERANQTRTIRIRMRVDDVELLRGIAEMERRPAQDQAAWMLEQAIRDYVGPSEADDEEG